MDQKAKGFFMPKNMSEIKKFFPASRDWPSVLWTYGPDGIAVLSSPQIHGFRRSDGPRLSSSIHNSKRVAAIVGDASSRTPHAPLAEMASAAVGRRPNVCSITPAADPKVQRIVWK